MSQDGVQATGEPGHSGEWECMECGHIEAGVMTLRPEACPNCGAPGEALDFFSYEDEGDPVEWDDTSA